MPTTFRQRIQDGFLVALGTFALLCLAVLPAQAAGEARAHPVAAQVGDVTVDEHGTLSADRPLLSCPVEQESVKPGARPNPKVIAEVIRCLWEKPAPKGMDGAATIDLGPLQIGTPRKWNPRSDLGSGNLDTDVYPVKTKYTWKTFYRMKTVVRESLAIFNCYVNAFGEWQCGLAQTIKDGESVSIPRQP